MNQRHRSILLGLLVAGLVGFAMLGKGLHNNGKLDEAPRNVLHLKGSPFGRTLALAMRGPVDIYWHRGAPHSHGEGEHAHGDHADCEDCQSGHPHDHGDHHHGDCEHEDCDHPDHGGDGGGAQLAAKLDDAVKEAAGAAEAEGSGSGVRTWLLDNIDEMKTAYYSRTNPRADSRLHRAFILGETQKRLRLSYEMDPTNNACYGAYFMFLSEAVARIEGQEEENGVIRSFQQRAMKLAVETMDYCLRYRDEAPAMITSASAAHDFLQIYLSNPKPDPKLAIRVLRVLDGSLQQYEAIRGQMIREGTWENFSVHRRNEMQGAHQLVRKLREGDHRALLDLTNTAGLPQPVPGS